MIEHSASTSTSATSNFQPGLAPMSRPGGLGLQPPTRHILVVDDHPLMRAALGETILHLDNHCKVYFANSKAHALEMIEDPNRIDLILLDLRLPDCVGLDALLSLRESAPHIPLVVLSGETARETILECIEYGAVGYVPKTMESGGVTHALKMVLSGHIFVPLDLISTGSVSDLTRKPKRPRGGDPRELGLTSRQVEVLKLILQGLPNKIICKRLALAEGTVKVHVAGVLRTLGVHNRTQAVVAANELGLRFG
jgi:DNA-binding NarL/FixJ family response regulator